MCCPDSTTRMQPIYVQQLLTANNAGEGLHPISNELSKKQAWSFQFESFCGQSRTRESTNICCCSLGFTNLTGPSAATASSTRAGTTSAAEYLNHSRFGFLFEVFPNIIIILILSRNISSPQFLSYMNFLTVWELTNIKRGVIYQIKRAVILQANVGTFTTNKNITLHRQPPSPQAHQ